MFFRLALVSFILCELACSSEPVGTGFSSEEQSLDDTSGGELRPPPVMCEPAGNVGTPEQELEAWQREMTAVRLAWARELEDRDIGLRFARALHHIVGALAAGESCYALSVVANYSNGFCSLQSLEARAIMRCNFDTLAERCRWNPELVRRVRRGLYHHECHSGEEYQP